MSAEEHRTGAGSDKSTAIKGHIAEPSTHESGELGLSGQTKTAAPSRWYLVGRSETEDYIFFDSRYYAIDRFAPKTAAMPPVHAMARSRRALLQHFALRGRGASGPRVLFPGKSFRYAHYNGLHPLLMSLFERRYNEFEVVMPGDDMLEVTEDGVEIFSEALVEFTQMMLASHPSVDEQHIHKVVREYGARYQMQLSDGFDLIFLHTLPLIINQVPWILHIEHPNSVFWPMVVRGGGYDSDITQSPYYHMVKAQLESDYCQMIFTHLKSTRIALPRIFNSQKIEKKLRYIPLGIQRRPPPKKPGDGIKRYLFINSWHQHGDNFYLRGGLDVLSAWMRLAEKHPDVELMIRSALPETLPEAIGNRLRAHPRIHWIRERQTDEQMDRLFEEADFFLLPSAALHSISILRAMQAGCVCVLADVWGLDEYIEESVNAVVVKGRKGPVWYVDPKTNVVRENYERMWNEDPEYSDAFYQTLERLYGDKEQCNQIAENAIAYVIENHRLEMWQLGFQQIANGVLRGLRSPSVAY